jgi:uncharacterized protein GlcG (DUF336 family)
MVAGILLVLLITGWHDSAAARRRRPRKPPPPTSAEPPPAGAACPLAPAGGCNPLTAAEVDGLLAAASSIAFSTLAVAVVDRPGNVLGLWVKGAPSLQVQDTAVGLARTGAFFSNDQAPLSSRTVRFVSGLHFPPGVARTPNAALYGIESTNRGCDLNVVFNAGCGLAPAVSLGGGACNATGLPGSTSGCGTGPVTGKVVDLSGAPVDSDPFAVNPGGLPVYRGTELVGGLGVAGVPAGQIEAAEAAAFSAIVAGGLSPVPSPLPEPGVVFIDGIRLPFVRRTGGVPVGAPGAAAVPTIAGQCAPEEYLAGPAGNALLAMNEVERIVRQAVSAANRTRAVIRLPPGSKTRMVIAVGDANGDILAVYRMPDATVFSVDVAVAKARNVAWFSGAGAADLGLPANTAVTSRTISFAAQPLFPAGIDGSGPGPFFNLFAENVSQPCKQGTATGPNQNGVVYFPGSIPLYKGNVLVGGLGVSGDGVEQDDYVSWLGADGFRPPKGLWADNVFINGVRLPFLKFPRNPER